ncbi:DUF1722 domain-containing protein [Macrococcus brunensis]|uniref:DUF1722 domain-containing protein n=1 Tax=Macrococcus brunensis TaxID=198483 RepID=A0A4R6BEU5_9STAP|nr:YbgA family protein [Macrococcus brunensis]TDL98360.1 DUF1722 domain-containing protein [Macrococcus brunensis]ULG72023.1 YbgA family protein [Macrococcus brunensis]ULG74276.1 YbgA family protein [Macrococcus brunensis]
MVNQKEQKKAVEKRWREEKYKVMYHSQQHYNDIRGLMKEQLTDIDILNTQISEAYALEPTHGSMLNTFQHLWGYFKNKATPEEKELFLPLLNQVPEKNDVIIQQLHHLALKYNVKYLKESSILTEKN